MCIRSKDRKQNQTLQIRVQIWRGKFRERFEEFTLISVILWFITHLYYHVNAAKDFVSTSDRLALSFWMRKTKKASEKCGPRRPSAGEAPKPDWGLQGKTRKMMFINQGPLADSA